jgi:hypothetical protein
MLYREIIAVCSQTHKSHKYSLWAEQSSMPFRNVRAGQTREIILTGNEAGCSPEQAGTL